MYDNSGTLFIGIYLVAMEDRLYLVAQAFAIKYIGLVIYLP